LGQVLVRGRIRMPSPAARIMACLKGIVSVKALSFLCKGRVMAERLGQKTLVFNGAEVVYRKTAGRTA
jgi:hypothetical protein